MQAYKSHAHFMWTTNGFTKKLSIDCHHRVLSRIRPHYRNSLMVSSYSLNPFETTAYKGSMELNNHQLLWPPPLVQKF